MAQRISQSDGVSATMRVAGSDSVISRPYISVTVTDVFSAKAEVMLKTISTARNRAASFLDIWVSS